MNIVITMAGLGSRFRKAGYEMPKYMIEARGKTLFEWSVESLLEFREELFVFLVRKDDEAKDFISVICKKLGIEKIEIIELDELTRGQAETAMKASACWVSEEPILVYNIDTYVERGELAPDAIAGDGFIPCFDAPGDHWSFVRLGEGDKAAVEVREKKRISDHCSIGAYYFRSCKLYEDIYREMYVEREYLEKGERYIAPMYNILIEKGGKVYIQDIPSYKVHVLGTPEEVDAFIRE
ncbi:glycosyltransferase family 2 protein [Selenomonas sp. KH1T6]|uniref:glycosyltransferase family 2 protein n=1 Tax=Selenomonas sp. KH1T6 TaxID=3158784 RepID=UPI0008A7BD73|nr:2-C-methyl-D-erythritol 4-phosphate cytidylyltransferase [Selenomonas ruminantium]